MPKSAPTCDPTSRSPESVNRLVAAAVVNENFCNLLLTKPAVALEQGYQGETFDLDQRDAQLILSIRANSLSDFAQQYLLLKDEHTAPVLASGSGNWFPSQCSSVVLDAE